ncbi:MAG: PAS domain S-box protein [Proteobacteria bacterium]|nr:PAS domain S-box protein [Pseudomonadota bacterium]
MAEQPTYEELIQRVADLERKLEHSEESDHHLKTTRMALNSVLSAAPMGIGLVSDRMLMWVNQQMCEMVGRTREELLGQSARILYPSDEEFLRVGKEKYDAIHSNGWGSIETCFVRKNGGIIHVLLSSVPVNPGDLAEGVTFTAMDVTEIKQERDRAKMYLDTAGVILLALDRDGNIRLINKKGCETIGYPESEVLNQNWFDGFLPKKEQQRAKIVFQSMLEGDERHLIDYENVLLNRQGEELDILWHNTLLRTSEGKVEGVFCSGLDVSNRNQMEREKEELQIQLIKTQKMEAIGVLAGGIAHDFNNILLPILGYTELLIESSGEDSSTREILNQVLQAAKRARSLVKQILTFSRQENQEIKPVDVGQILNEVLKLIRSSLPSTIEVRQYISSKCGLVMADPSQIHQITMNLVTNAYHAMEESGGQLFIKLTDSEMHRSLAGNSSIQAGRYVCMTVSDTGTGMEQHVISRIFDPYFTTKKKGKGTGLGLSVVHGIIKSYNGDVEVESTPGEGTVFRVYLPVIQRMEEGHGDASASPDYARGTESILLVDDESQIIQMESQRLEYLGYHVTSRTSSLEALELFKNDPYRFDLVITDMTMPKMTGGQLSEELLEIRPDIPIILCTGFSEKINAEKAKEIGVRGFIPKPILLNEIASLIRTVLDQKDQTP